MTSPHLSRRRASVSRTAHTRMRKRTWTRKRRGTNAFAMAEEIQTKHFQLLALKKPAAPVSRITTAKQWDAFIKEFAGIEIGTGKQLRYTPDFKREQVLALFAGPELRGDDYMGIEVYDGENHPQRLRVSWLTPSRAKTRSQSAKRPGNPSAALSTSQPCLSN